MYKLKPVEHDPFETAESRVKKNARAMDESERVVNVHVGKVDGEWAKTPDFRIPPQAPGESFKLDRAKKFIMALAANHPFDAPKMGVSDNAFGFDDGRHRFAAMRDLGFSTAPVAMDPASVENARKRGWLAD